MCNFKFFFCFLCLFCILGCQNTKETKPDPELATIELIRGDLILCSGKQFGEVSFALSCQDGVRENFDLAVSLLHSFEYDEAEKAFVQVIDADPDCAMAYWGVAMSIYHALWAAPTEKELEKGSKILKIAESLPKTTREKDYLDAIGAYFKDWSTIDHKTRALRYEQQMEGLYKRYRDDPEAAILYALALNSTADPADKNYTNQRKAGGILESIFPDQPNHPGIAHYIIHNYDNPVLAPLALNTARRYAEIAPASAHAQHMPSHIFTRLGYWDESIQSNLNSMEAARCYAEGAGIEGHWDEELHGMDYLVYAYLQKADNQKAGEQYEYLKTIKKVYPANFKIAYAFSAIPSRIALENKQWMAAANLELHNPEFPWEQFPWEKSVLHFARALGASRIGKIDLAEQELSTLQSLHGQLVAKNDTYKAKQVLIQIKGAQAWIQFAKGKRNEAVTLMKEAADLEDTTEKHPVTPGEVIPARELLGDLLLAMNKPSEALAAYEADLKGRPNRFNGLYGAAMAAKNAGDTRKAKTYYESLLKLVEGSESDRPEILAARAFVDKA